MTIGAAANNGFSSPSEEWINIMIEVEPVSEAKPDGVTRSERYRHLKQNADFHRKQLKEWIDCNGLGDEVKSLGEATAFNLLFVRCTPHAAAELTHAPGVVSVVIADDHSVDAQTLAYA